MKFTWTSLLYWFRLYIDYVKCIDIYLEKFYYALGAPRAQRGHIGFTLASVVCCLSSPHLFFFKSLPTLFQSVGREVNKNSQWKFWNFLTIFKVFRTKNWKIVKNFKIELVPQFCLDPKDTWGLVRYRFWPKNVGIRIFVPVYLKNGFKNMRFSAFRVHGWIFSVAHEQTLIFHLEFISGIRFLKSPFFNKKMVFFRVFKIFLH